MKKNLKKIISTVFFIISALCLFACDDNTNNANNTNTGNTSSNPEPWIHEPQEVYLLQIENEDVFETGYYEYFFDFEEQGDINYRLSTKAVFQRMWDTDTEWKVYVSDRHIGEHFIESYFEHKEPALINDGEFEIHSGQWIYLFCEHNSSNSDEPNKAGYSIKYPFGKQPDRIEMTPDDEAEYFLTNHYDFLTGSNYTKCDVTGDGYDDYCTGRMTGSGMVRIQLIVYDQKNHVDYVLDGYNYDYRTVGVEDGKLIVEESGPNGYGDPIIKTEGTVMIDEDDRLVFVKELSERDLRDFEDYDDFDEEWIEDKIKEISITSAEEIEYARWVDDAKSVLQIGIEYEWPRDDRWTNHKKDYFVFKDDYKTLMVDYSFGETTGSDRMVFENPTFESHFEDVNFDGVDELIIHRGTNGNSGMEMYSAYELKDGEYVFFPEFEWIYSYTVNWSNKTIECVRSSGDAENKTYIETYSYEDGKYYKIDEKESK